MEVLESLLFGIFLMTTN